MLRQEKGVGEERTTRARALSIVRDRKRERTVLVKKKDAESRGSIACQS